MFSSLYQKVLIWSRHRHAERYLAGLSFAESSFFPIPPDVMLAPMALANRQRAWRYALITTLFSVLGGIAGYLIGYYLFEEVGLPVIEFYHAEEKFAGLKNWFDQYGAWVVFLAGFSPIPYKIFTVGAGVMSLGWLPFVVASLIGRGARFFLVAGAVVFGGDRLENFFNDHVNKIGWSVVVITVLGLLLYRQLT